MYFFLPLLFGLQASYLVGVSDPHSQSGHEGLVDPIQFARAHQAIQMACQNLVDPASSPSQVSIHFNEELLTQSAAPKSFRLLGSHRVFAVMSLPIVPHATHVMHQDASANQNEPRDNTVMPRWE